MYLRFKDLSGMGAAIPGLPGGPLPGGLETKTLLVAPMTMPSYDSPTQTYGGTTSGVGGGVVPPAGGAPLPGIAVLPPVGGGVGGTGCVEYADPVRNRTEIKNACDVGTQYLSKAKTVDAQIQAFKSKYPLSPNAAQYQAIAQQSAHYIQSMNSDLLDACGAKCFDEADRYLQHLLRTGESLNGLIQQLNNLPPCPNTFVYTPNVGCRCQQGTVEKGGVCVAPDGNPPVAPKKGGGSLVAANLPGSTNYGESQNENYGGDWGGDFLSTPMFDNSGFDNWGGGGGGYGVGPGFDQFTDVPGGGGAGGGDGLSLDYTSGGDQAPGDTFGAPEIEIPQDQGIDLNLPAGNEGGVTQGKKFPWWLLLVGGAVLAMSNDGKGKKKGKR